MDSTLNELVPIDEEKEQLAKKLMDDHHKNLRRLRDSGEITEAEFENRDAMDDPTFWKGETIILKGYKFRIDHIARRKIILKPIRG